MQTVALLATAYARIGRSKDAARVIEGFQSITLQNANAIRAPKTKRSGAAYNPTAPDVAAWARHFELGLVTWVVGADSTAVAYVEPDGAAIALPIARGRREIEGAVRRLREAVLSDDPALVNHRLHDVRAELLPNEIALRIDERSRSAARGRLLFLLHGPLERLPAELFSTQDGASQVSFVPIVLPGLPAAEPESSPARAAFDRWILLGSPSDRSNVPLLPGAQAELKEIAALRSDSKLFIGSTFDRDTITRALKGDSSLQIATHLSLDCGQDSGRLADVGLELSRGDSFCAQEILDAGPIVPLVVLDACETAGGRFVDSEGLQGISSAFLESGTRNLVVTLWPVDDRSAREFAVAFHRDLMSGSRPSEAVDRARSQLRAAGRSTADWSAFRAIGRD
jgi:CHAT domain-containing protein